MKLLRHLAVLSALLCLACMPILAAPQEPAAAAARADSAKGGVPRLVKHVGQVSRPVHVQVTEGETGTPTAAQPARAAASVTFAVYAEREGGAALWQETQNVALDADGRFSVLLGAASREGMPAELFASGEPRWLGVRVNVAGDAEASGEQPRVLLVSVPYALHAADAETLGGRAATDFVLREELAGWSGAAAGVLPGAADRPRSVGGSQGVVNATGAVSFIPRVTSINTPAVGDVTYGDSQIFDDGTNIRIGNAAVGTGLVNIELTTPQARNAFNSVLRLENATPISGTVISAMNLTGADRGTANHESFQVARFTLLKNVISTGIATNFDAVFATTSFINQNAPYTVVGWRAEFPRVATGMTLGTYYGLFLEAPLGGGGTVTNAFALVTAPGSGNVGIGTTAPAHLLDVAGNARVSGAIRAGQYLDLAGNPITGTGDITGVITNAGSGLEGGVSAGDAVLSLLTTCLANQILRWNGTQWVCSNDVDTDSGGDITDIITPAGSGLLGGAAAGGVTLSMVPCPEDSILKRSGGFWVCTPNVINVTGTVPIVVTSPTTDTRNVAIDLSNIAQLNANNLFTGINTFGPGQQFTDGIMIDGANGSEVQFKMGGVPIAIFGAGSQGFGLGDEVLLGFFGTGKSVSFRDNGDVVFDGTLKPGAGGIMFADGTMLTSMDGPTFNENVRVESATGDATLTMRPAFGPTRSIIDMGGINVAYDGSKMEWFTGGMFGGTLATLDLNGVFTTVGTIKPQGGIMFSDGSMLNTANGLVTSVAAANSTVEVAGTGGNVTVKVAPGGVTGNEIAPNAVTGDKIADGTLGAADIDPAANVAVNSITTTGNATVGGNVAAANATVSGVVNAGSANVTGPTTLNGPTTVSANSSVEALRVSQAGAGAGLVIDRTNPMDGVPILQAYLLGQVLFGVDNDSVQLYRLGLVPSPSMMLEMSATVDDDMAQPKGGTFTIQNVDSGHGTPQAAANLNITGPANSWISLNNPVNLKAMTGDPTLVFSEGGMDKFRMRHNTMGDFFTMERHMGGGVFVSAADFNPDGTVDIVALNAGSGTISTNLGVTGTVTAGMFVGDGSGLTNLPGGGGGPATDVQCTGCVDGSDVNTAQVPTLAGVNNFMNRAIWNFTGSQTPVSITTTGVGGFFGAALSAVNLGTGPSNLAINAFSNDEGINVQSANFSLNALSTAASGITALFRANGTGATALRLENNLSGGNLLTAIGTSGQTKLTMTSDGVTTITGSTNAPNPPMVTVANNGIGFSGGGAMILSSMGGFNAALNVTNNSGGPAIRTNASTDGVVSVTSGSSGKSFVAQGAGLNAMGVEVDVTGANSKGINVIVNGTGSTFGLDLNVTSATGTVARFRRAGVGMLELTGAGVANLNANTNITGATTITGATAVTGNVTVTGAATWNGQVTVGTATPGASTLEVVVGGSTLADLWTERSSRRWKADIRPLIGALGLVERLQGVSYTPKVGGKRDIGFIAEDVGAVLPEVVKFEANGVDAQGLDYSRLTAVLVEAMKEQQAQIRAQQERNEKLERELAELRALVGKLVEEGKNPKQAPR